MSSDPKINIPKNRHYDSAEGDSLDLCYISGSEALGSLWVRSPLFFVLVPCDAHTLNHEFYVGMDSVCFTGTQST